MAVIFFALVVVIVVALAIWIVDMIPLPSPINMIVKVVIGLLGLLLIVNRAGLV